MNTVEENSALSMDSSPLPTPTPPIPQLTHPPDPFNSSQPSQPPSTSIPLNTTVANRQIREPVPPSKRTLTEISHNDIGEEMSNVSKFIPQELAEIFAIRQRRERAWHARILICTSVISNIDSTLADFKDEISREEATAFQVYLRQAISKFAAHDSLPTPTPPPIPSKSFQKKQSEIPNPKLPNKPIVVATPIMIPTSTAFHDPTHVTQLRENSTTQSTWATVTRNGQKKTRVTKANNTKSTQAKKANHVERLNEPRALSNLPRRQALEGKSTPPGNVDKRIFLRLPQEHEWRNLSPAGIREIVVKKLAISIATIGRIKPVNTGFALSPCSNDAREKILEAQHGLFMSGAKLEPATNWVSVIVPTVPTYIRTLLGKIEVNKIMLADEIERVSSVRPSFLKLYGHNNPAAPHRTWMALFAKAPKPGFRVFDESGLVMIHKKKKPLAFCKRCNGHHPSKNCSRASSCGNCGSTMHTEDICMAVTKCKNCGGPHRSDSRRCLARPTRSGIPTKEQLKSYRQAGEREFQAVARVKEAELKAATAEESMLDLDSSQKTDSNSSETQASTVEDSTVDAMRL
ncbi:putative eka-like protein [Erysiphe necator]|uniref:Putative eka-like protein n=1 Tax=Uncinula necator TaxID=52586 RepID=A0A0B1P5J0_UNCNE|nr:putative eka-like protein [Erysiphe necator]